MRIVFASCDAHGTYTWWERVRQLAPDVFIAHGDTPYVNYVAPFFSVSTTQAIAEAKFNSFWGRPGPVDLLAMRSQGMLAYWQADDHEWGGDNWDHTVTQANAQTGLGATTQAQVNAHWKASNDAQEVVQAALFDNPAWNRAGNTERPSQALTESQNPPASDYPIRYFVQDFNSDGSVAAGPAHCRVIFLDCISYKSPIAAADSAAKHFLGVQQEAWLEQRLLEAVTAQVPFVFISSGKKVFRGTVGDNGDTLGSYPTAQARVLSMIDSTGATPIWLSGDKHRPHVMEARKQRGDACDLIDVCACPGGVKLNALMAPGSNIVWQGNTKCVGQVDVGSDSATVQIVHAEQGGALWSATFAPRSNVPIYGESMATVL